jgi:ACT domain-containing protein
MQKRMGPEDIARITQAVVQKLGDGKVSGDVLRQAVESATSRPPYAAPETSVPTPVEAGSDARKRIIVASFGLNRPGIVASISAVLAENLCSIEDMSQRIMQEFYTLIMIVDITPCNADFATLSEKLKTIEEKLGVTILAQHEDVFRYMHRV